MEFTGERFIPGQQGSIELEHLNRYYFVVHQIELKDKTVLDIASGEGYGTNILAKYAQRVIGVDISAEAIKHAGENYLGANLKFLIGSTDNIPIDNQSVDVVVSFETIEHHDKHTEMMTEIKRVLKTDGTLVISSPDKYYYSDLPNAKNEFHVKELYSEEFKDLMRGFFKKTFFYAQKTFTGSIIALEENDQFYKKPVIVDNEGNSFEFTPVYNVAIGTDSPDFSPPNQLVFYQKFDEIRYYADIEAAMQSVRNTKAFRLGKIILKPFSYLRTKLHI